MHHNWYVVHHERLRISHRRKEDGTVIQTRPLEIGADTDSGGDVIEHHSTDGELSGEQKCQREACYVTRQYLHPIEQHWQGI